MTLGPAPSLTRARALGWLSECATTLPKHVLELCRLSFRQEFEIQDTQGDGVGFRVQGPSCLRIVGSISSWANFFPS